MITADMIARVEGALRRIEAVSPLRINYWVHSSWSVRLIKDFLERARSDPSLQSMRARIDREWASIAAGRSLTRFDGVSARCLPLCPDPMLDDPLRSIENPVHLGRAIALTVIQPILGYHSPLACRMESPLPP